jgi:hypothetical protein
MNNFQTYRQFLNYIESNYDEQQIIIEIFISYYINEYRKFGKYNCKDTYNDDIKNDKTGELHKLGVIGFEFEKKYTMNANLTNCFNVCILELSSWEDSSTILHLLLIIPIKNMYD